MLEIVETLDFRHVYPYDALLWLTQDAYVSQKNGFEGWHISFKLNDGGIVKASPQNAFKAIQLLTCDLFNDFIIEKQKIAHLNNYPNKEQVAYHIGIADGLKLAMKTEYCTHIWILATRIYENMTGIDRSEL